MIRYHVTWVNGEKESKYGIYPTYDAAFQSILDWWKNHNFTPPYIRRWTTDSITTIDYGRHNMFYKIYKIDN